MRAPSEKISTTGLSAGGDSGIRDCYAFFMQAMVAARKKNKLANGYHLVPRIHLIDWAFQEAVKSDAAWQAARERIGFGTLARGTAQALGNNDFMLVAMSYATELDYRDFFDMFGVQTSDQARDQVASFGFPSVGRSFFALGVTGHNHGAMSTRVNEFQELPIDGTTPWPLP